MSKFSASKLLAAAAIIFMACSCETQHFLTDATYRNQVETDLQSRLDENPSLKQFYNVDASAKKVTSDEGYVKDLTISNKEKEALEFMYAYMPLADLTDYPTDYYLQNVRAAFNAEEELGWDVPERVFRHFVLPIRVNNENLDTSRVAFYKELKPRVEGLSMKDAILEVNHWCHEKLSYHGSDARTSSPLSSYKNSLGRCGEESTFTVAALRSAGIPARQVYTPRWAHSDDNHAWVEAWADGEWHFLGACEPEAVLDLGWFNAPASRGLLMHTRVFGRYDGPEEKVLEGPQYTEINLIDNYAKTAKAEFQIVDEAGNPVPDAMVDFRIYNYAEFYPAITKFADKDGKTFLTAGKGDMLVWAAKDGLYGYSKVSFGRDSLVTVTITKEHPYTPQEMMIVPPPENVVLPEVTPEQREANNIKTAREDSIRKAYMATFIVSDGTPKGDLLAKSAGNHETISAFLEAHPDDRAIELLKSLSDKDLRDVTLEILEDSYNAENSILCPRVEDEFLSPYKSFFLSQDGLAEKVSTPSALIEWVKDSIKVTTNAKAWRVPESPKGVYLSRLADVRSRNIFFVALARTFGIDARRDPITGKVQYRENGEWIDVDFESGDKTVAPVGTLVLKYTPKSFLENPNYYTNFTLTKIEDGHTTLMAYDEGDVDMGGGVSWASTFKKGAQLDAGEYILVSGNRLSDGSVPVTLQQFTIKEGETTTLDLQITSPDDKLPVIGSFDSETLYKKTADSDPVSILSTTGRGHFVVGFLSPRKEPSVHALSDICAAKADLEAWGRPIVLLTTAEGLDWLKEYSSKLPSTASFGIMPADIPDGHANPYFIIADTFNRVFFESEGYTIGLGNQIATAIHKL